MPLRLRRQSDLIWAVKSFLASLFGFVKHGNVLPRTAAASSFIFQSVMLLLVANCLGRTPWSKNRRFRDGLVIAARILMASFTSFELTRIELMHGDPHTGLGVVIDAARILLGSRTVMLALMAIGVRLDPVAHLCVQLLCFLRIASANTDVCHTQLMAHPLTTSRVALFNEALESLLAAMTMPISGVAPRGTQAQCVAFLTFLQLFLGVLLSTWLVMCMEWADVLGPVQRMLEIKRHRRAAAAASAAAAATGSDGGVGQAATAASVGAVRAEVEIEEVPPALAAAGVLGETWSEADVAVVSFLQQTAVVRLAGPDTEACGAAWPVWVLLLCATWAITASLAG